MKENKIIIQHFLEKLIENYPAQFENVLDISGADHSDILFFLYEVGEPDELITRYLEDEISNNHEPEGGLD